MNTIVVQWDAALDNVGIKGYLLEINGGEPIDVGNVLIYYHENLLSNTDYTYRLKAYDFSNNPSNDWSAPLVVRSCFSDFSLPTIPLNFRGVGVGGIEIDLSWDASTDDVGVAGYILLIGGYSFDVGNVLSYNDTGLTSGETYSYHVRSYDAAGNKSAWSDEVLIHLGSLVKEGAANVKESTDLVVEG